MNRPSSNEPVNEVRLQDSSSVKAFTDRLDRMSSFTRRHSSYSVTVGMQRESVHVAQRIWGVLGGLRIHRLTIEDTDKFVTFAPSHGSPCYEQLTWGLPFLQPLAWLFGVVSGLMTFVKSLLSHQLTRSLGLPSCNLGDDVNIPEGPHLESMLALCARSGVKELHLKRISHTLLSSPSTAKLLHVRELSLGIEDFDPCVPATQGALMPFIVKVFPALATLTVRVRAPTLLHPSLGYPLWVYDIRNTNREAQHSLEHTGMSLEEVTGDLFSIWLLNLCYHIKHMHILWPDAGALREMQQQLKNRMMHELFGDTLPDRLTISCGDICLDKAENPFIMVNTFFTQLASYVAYAPRAWSLRQVDIYLRTTNELWIGLSTFMTVMHEIMRLVPTMKQFTLHLCLPCQSYHKATCPAGTSPSGMCEQGECVVWEWTQAIIASQTAWRALTTEFRWRLVAPAVKIVTSTYCRPEEMVAWESSAGLPLLEAS